MNENLSRKPLESGVFQGNPGIAKTSIATSPIRTMKSDIADAIKNQNETLVSIALAEEKKQAKQRAENVAQKSSEQTSETPAPKRVGRFFVIIIIILILAGLGFSYQFLLPKLSSINLPSISMPNLPSFGNTPPEITPVINTIPKVELAPSLIPAQSEKRFIINKESPEKILSNIANERMVTNASGTITNLYFAEESSVEPKKTTAISANRLIILTGAPVPETLTRSLESSFMAGFLSEAGNSASTPFLVFKVSSYETGLAGMLEWERSMPRLFDAIFGTSVTTSVSNRIKTRDMVILGHDARVLEIAPNVGISYVFANPQTIIIAESKTALESLIPLVK